MLKTRNPPAIAPPAAPVGPRGCPASGRVPNGSPSRSPQRHENAFGSIFSAGELVSAFEAFDAVSADVADMYHSAEYY
jgi:hypothetical protein